jgi:diguanylate cyclase (GGDEF)-like protein
LCCPPDLASGGVSWTGAPPAFSITEGIGTIEDRFAGATLAAANTAREQARRAFTLEQLAFRDPLTGMGNRRAFDDGWATITAGPSATPPALIMIDVDRFKLINDTFGHDAGDRALTRLARCIEQSVRPGDLPVRFGGDEFAVLLPATSAADAATVAERIRCTVRDELLDPQVSVSVGVGVGFDCDLRATALEVDRALYEAKQQGRDQVGIAGGGT